MEKNPGDHLLTTSVEAQNADVSDACHQLMEGAREWLCHQSADRRVEGFHQALKATERLRLLGFSSSIIPRKSIAVEVRRVVTKEENESPS